MAFKINLTLYTIVLLWTSVSGTLYPFSGNWSVEAETCGNEGIRTDERTFVIEAENPADFPYDALNNETIVTADGKLGARTEVTGPNLNTSMRLNHFNHIDNFKKYSARLWVTGGTSGQTQQAYVEPTVTIYDNATVLLRLSAYADSQNAQGCAEAKSIISQISVNV